MADVKVSDDPEHHPAPPAESFPSALRQQVIQWEKKKAQIVNF